jgi:hypothetical protein
MPGPFQAAAGQEHDGFLLGLAGSPSSAAVAIAEVGSTNNPALPGSSVA